jgi:CheY-like chemotaxis protein
MSGKKILIVDDNYEISELTGSRLEANGYEVVIANDGESACLKAKQYKPDLILLDVVMPVIDGFEIGRRLKADPQTRAIPIVMLTAKGDRESIEKALNELKAVDYVLKPFNPLDLLKTVKTVLEETEI